MLIVSVDGGCPGVKNVADGVIGATSQQYPLLMASMGIEAIEKFADTGDEAGADRGQGLHRHRRDPGHRQAGRRRRVDRHQGRPGEVLGLRSLATLRLKSPSGRRTAARRPEVSRPGGRTIKWQTPNPECRSSRRRSPSGEVASFERHHKPLLERVQHVLHSNPALVPLIVLMLSIALFGVLLGGKFFSAFSLTLILQQVAITGIVGAAQTLVILTAGIDLSVGAIMVLSSVVMGQFTFRYGMPVPISILCGFAVGAFCRLHQRLPRRAGEAAALHRHPRHVADRAGGELPLFRATRRSARRRSRRSAPLLQFFGQPIKLRRRGLHLWRHRHGAARARALNYVLNHTAWGRHVYAIGDDPDAAELAGVQVPEDADLGLHAVRPDLRARPAGC